MSKHTEKNNSSTGPIAITHGDVCGIGPEICARWFASAEAAGCFVVGDIDVMRRAVAQCKAMLAVASIERPADAFDSPLHCIPVLQVETLPTDLLQAPIGRVDARAG